ncbi:hypothetical protein [Pectinatus frisingensis]|uniref:hypothetical protein n=1 Tax=Pectinatus frisingensis TaxID=865 RepID=UPI0018C489CB|nr:hypothetical protein [Pectinatus frisingensis]
MKKIVLIITLFLICILSGIVFAQKADYVNKNYNAHNIKNILVAVTVPQGANVFDDYATIKIEDDIKEAFSNDTNIHITMMDDVISQINRDNNIDIIQLTKTDPQTANQYFVKYAAPYDTALEVDVLDYSNGKSYVGANSYNTTEYQNVTATDSYGNITNVTVPQTVTHNIPAHYVGNATVGLNFTLRDMSTNQVIFARKEIRTRDNDAFNTAACESIAKRIVNNYVNNTIDMIKK